MGRIKVFLRSFCLTGRNDQSHSEPSFDQGIDVSHLAEPHITTSPSQIYEQASPSIQNCESNNDEHYLNSNGHQRATPNSCAISAPSSQRNSLLTTNHDDGSPFARPASSLHQENSSSQPSSPPYASSPSNIYEPQNDQYNPSTPEPNQNQPQPSNQPSPAIAPRDAPIPGPSFGGPTKLSYDIISVREPLAKILAERQQLLQTQQQQRQLLGEHDYIEVYGERGSSCFYEEIAGSVTSSATYDQIGANSNHNYQVLINAYAVANRQSTSNQENDNARLDNTHATNGASNHEENAYDVTSHPCDQVDGPSTSARIGTGTGSAPNPPSKNGEDSSQLAHSIPVYSVINKATRRSNTNMRNNLNDVRPPKPPPKNSPTSNHHQQQQSPNGNSSFDQVASSMSSAWSPSHQLPSTSTFLERATSNNESSGEEAFGSINTHRNVRLPQPPPRMSKHSSLNHTMDSRPLPSPNSNFENAHNNNNGNMLDRNNATEDDDIESMNNGYELLKSNMEDDQIDVGYEKIKESNRYSGGSISSQFYQRQLIDNGGYESVQPIYSSPSNALVEPNYEAIAPATASELAAAATAKLNAAASVIEQILKKDQ